MPEGGRLDGGLPSPDPLEVVVGDPVHQVEVRVHPHLPGLLVHRHLDGVGSVGQAPPLPGKDAPPLEPLGGLGEDGHVASLFPGHPALAATDPVLHVADSPKPPAARMTLGLSLLRRSGLCVLLATGQGKRAALTRLRRADPALPASALERLVVFTDLDDLEGFTDLDRLMNQQGAPR